jgi:glycosyltransferase involved in cell wall biosynthesis
MEWLGYITNKQRDKLLLELRCLVDPSWSIRYAKAGGHFNRTVIDALKCGALPIATRIGMEGFTGSNLFKEGVNYIGLDYDCIPSQYAAQVEQACNLPNSVASTIIENGRKLLARFECKTVAQQFIDFATAAQSYDTGRGDSGKLVTKAHETYADFFMPKTNIRDFL